MGTVPDLAEIEATIERMEARYRDHPAFPAYERLKPRFDADLTSPRDRALSKAAALMLIKYEGGVEGERGRGESPRRHEPAYQVIPAKADPSLMFSTLQSPGMAGPLVLEWDEVRSGRPVPRPRGSTGSPWGYRFAGLSSRVAGVGNGQYRALYEDFMELVQP